MKLAEALIARADLQKKISQLSSRMQHNAKVQEGEKAAEDINELLLLYETLMVDLITFIKKINHTNAITVFKDGTLSDAITERDCLKGRINTYRELYTAGIIRQERYSRTEIKFVRCIDPVKLQKQIDSLSKEYRELDTRIQETNWYTELVS